MTIGAICNREVAVIDRNNSVVDAAYLMREHHVGSLVVVETRAGRNVPVGMLTDRDIVIEVIAEDVPFNAVKVADVMSFELLTAREQDGIWDTLQRMRIKGVRRVPVVNEQGGLAGIVSVDDMLDLLADELSGLTKIIAREQALESRRRR